MIATQLYHQYLNPDARSEADRTQLKPIYRGAPNTSDASFTEDGDDSGSPPSGGNIPAFILGRHPVFMGSNGNSYIGIIGRGNSQALQIGRKPANLFLRQLAAQSGNRLKPTDLKAINDELTEYAELSGDVRDVFYRVAHTEDGVELDVGDDNHTRILITPGKVELITEGSQSFFYRTAELRPFALPADRGDIGLLDSYLNLHPADIVLLKGWLSYTLAHPKVPATNYVILVLQGDQGSGKSLLCRITQLLTDPNVVGVQAFPRQLKDMVVAAQHAHVLFFDNLREIRPLMADTLSIAATGGSVTARRLYSDAEQHVHPLHVALVLNGIHSFIEQPDLAQRCLPLHLRTLDEQHRRSEAEFLQAFHADLPRIFRGLLDLIAQIMEHLPSVKVTNPERMYDFVHWLAAMEKADGAPPGVYQMQYSSALNEGMLDSLQENPLAVTIMAFTEGLPDGGWTGTPTKLLQALNVRTGGISRDLPQNPISLSKRLGTLKVALQRQGIDIQLTRGRERRVTITHTEGTSNE
jgi:hypothetical protein